MTFLQLHEPPPVTHQLTLSLPPPTGSTGSGTAKLFNAARVSVPSLPEASDQGRAHAAGSEEYVAKDEDVYSQHFSF